MPDPRPLPINQVFERLQISDGLLITAERWQAAHDYHRQRQNFYYQALNQPGIVYGLGVALVDPPASVEARYRDRRWVQVQPGVAIDILGNPIVVPRPELFRIESNPPMGESQVVYLVISYVDPKELRHPPTKEMVPEQFRLVEKTEPAPQDVELCRIHLQGGAAQINANPNCFFPGLNMLDLRYRLQAQARPLAQIRVAQIVTGTPEDKRTCEGLTHLLQSVGVLFPPLQGALPVGQLSPTTLVSADLAAYDLIFLPRKYVGGLLPGALSTLQSFIQSGGTLLIVVDFDEVQIDELSSVKRELMEAIRNTLGDPTLADMRSQLESEIRAVENDIQTHMQGVSGSIDAFASSVGNPIEGEGNLHSQHPLRLYPYLFSRLPLVTGEPIHLLNWGGMVLMIGDLSASWGLDDMLQVPRDTIRTAQELGVNLLYFAHRRRQLESLQFPVSGGLSTISAQTVQTLTERTFGG